MDWAETLPNRCPPEDAISPSGEYFYRISKGNPVEDSDFFSQKKLAPDKKFTGEGIDECIIRAVSVYSNIEDAKRTLKLPKFKGGCIAKIVLNGDDGLIKKTFKKSHYSWWRTQSFDFTISKIVQS